MEDLRYIHSSNSINSICLVTEEATKDDLILSTYQVVILHDGRQVVFAAGQVELLINFELSWLFNFVLEHSHIVISIRAFHFVLHPKGVHHFVQNHCQLNEREFERPPSTDGFGTLVRNCVSDSFTVLITKLLVMLHSKHT